MSKWVPLIAGISLLPVILPVPATADMADVVAAAYGNYSVTAPTPSSVFICHGFGCKYRSEIALTGKDRAKLAQLLAAGRASAAAERRAVAAAGAWFDRRIGPISGTQHHVARAGYTYMFDKGQFDCIDASRNMTTLLLLLEQLKLLRHHDVAEPEARGFIIDGRPPHVTAVLVENGSGRKWAVDSWTRGYGQAPEIMPLSRWMTLD
jgi:hypothetical protein